MPEPRIVPGPRIDGGRSWDWLMQLAALTEAERPFTRRAFTPLYARGRSWLVERMRELGLETRIDPAGNLVGRLAGADPKAAGAILVGSHSDTVIGGGRFDGAAGVVAGLAIVQALRACGARLRHAFEVVDFLAEEPNDFGLSCIGSRGMSGALDEAMLERRSPQGQTLRAGLAQLGAPEGAPAAAVRRDIAGCFELHIEQGPILEQERVHVGVVTDIVGIRRLAVQFVGQAAHAGTTPFALRQDALTAAAHFLMDLRQALEQRPATPHVIATVGEMSIVPNAPNVIPGETRLTVDLRSTDAQMLQRWTERLQSLVDAAARVARVRSQVQLLSASTPTACAAPLAECLRAAASELGYSHRDLVSGAGHDAAFIGRIAPAAMLFVPSRAGLSHCKEEWTEAEELTRGFDTLLRAVVRFDTQAA